MIEHSFDRALIIGTFIYIICLGANANVFDLGTRHFETIGNSQLIPEGAVTAIEQDKAGYMWFGTQGGLVRYDGYNFTLFTHKPDDPGSIAGNFILTLWGAPDGRLWIGTIDKGVSVYDPKLDTFTHYKADKNDSGSLSHNWVRAFAGDNQGGVWVGTKDGLNYLPPKKNRFVRFYSEPNNANSLVDSQINALIFSKDNVLWIGTSGGVNKMQSNDWSFTVPFPDSEGQSPFKGQSIRSLLETADSKIWLGTRERGAHWILPDQEYGSLSLDKSKNGYLSHPWVFDMSQPSDREIWFATFGGGISIFDTELNKITQYEKHNPSNSYSINLNDLGSIKTDRSGLIWVGTWGGGLNRTNLKNSAFRTLRTNPNDKNALTSAVVASVLEAQNGQIWVGTSGNGIDIIDPKIGVIDGIRVTNNSKLGLKGGNVRALAQSDPNTIWIGTRQAGLYRYKLDSKELKNYNTLTGLADNMVRTMAADEDHVWIGTTYGLDRLNISSDTITHMPSIENKTEPMRSRLEMIVQQKDNTVWMTTDTGLYALSPGGDYLQPVRHDPLRDDSLSAQSLSLISLDQNDSVWVPTQNGVDKLLSWDGKIARFESISDHIEGDSKLLNSNLQFDSKGNAWSNGVVLNIESWQLTKLGQVNGIEVGGVEQTSGHRTRNNILLFGGTSGLLMIDPTKYQSWDFNPSLHITSVKVDNIIKKLKPDELLTLQPGTKGLAIEFSALDFSAPSDNQYAYQLVGYDNKWIETDSDHRVANYTNLDPGQYQLRIKGSNRHGQWSPNEITLPLKQLPAWYQTLWFKALSVLMVVSLVIIIYRLRLRQLNLQKRALKRLVKKRTADILMLSEIGRNLTSSLKFDDVIEQVYGSLNKVLDAHVFLLGIVDDDSNQLQIPFMVEGQQKMESWCLSLNDHARPGVWCVNHQSEVIIQNEVDRQKYISLAKPPSKVGHQMGTVVYQPLVIDEKIIGCLSIQSPDENSYTDKHLDMIRTLSSYTAIAVANSLGYSKLKTSNLKLEQAHSEVAMAHNELEKTYKKLEMQSLTDQLTGAHNRRFLRKFIPLEISDLRRDVFKSIKNDSKNLNVQSVASSQPICGFLLIDADHFKWVNDNYGHEAGDQVLIQLVEVIKATCRETDWVVRWGGEEFIIIARNTLRAELHRLAERIRHNVEAHSFDLGNGRNLHRTCSIGVAAFPFVLSHFDLLTWEQTINIADRAMYTSKINGRNAWVSLFDKNVTSFDSFYRQVNEHLPDLVDRRIIGCDSSLTTENIKFN